MGTTVADRAFAAVRETDPAILCRDDTERLLREVRQVRSWLDCVEMEATRRLRELSADGRSEAPDALLGSAVGRTSREAKAVSERTDLCDEVPTLAESLASGEVTSTHLDAIHAAARDLPETVRKEFLTRSDELIARARRIGVDSFRRECRELAKHLLARSRVGSDAEELEAQRAASKLSRWVDRVTGMHHTHLEIDPVRDAQLSATFNAELARMRAADANGGVPWQQVQVDAFVNAVAGIRTPSATTVTRDARADRSSACRCGSRRRADRVPQVTVLVDLDRLTGRAEAGICETENGVPLPVSTVRRLCCDAEIIPALLGTSGEVLDQGRSVRTATEAQRRALRAMHRGCAYPECGVGFDACRMHHVRWWGRDHGATDLANLVPVCERHHHMIHEGGWELTITADRIASWTRPDGTLHHTGPTIDRVLARPNRAGGDDP